MAVLRVHEHTCAASQQAPAWCMAVITIIMVLDKIWYCVAMFRQVSSKGAVVF
jgi:hypothetical protein